MKTNTPHFIIVSGPSGAGKGTLINALIAENPLFEMAISATTRSPRTGESNGKEYHFLDDAEFDIKVSEDAFLEWCHVHHHRYGTLISEIDRLANEEKWALIEIDTQGAAKIKAKFPDAYQIFIAPPSMEELKKRLIGRDTENEAIINDRMRIAQEELTKMNDYDVVLVNQELEYAIKEFNDIVTSFVLGR